MTLHARFADLWSSILKTRPQAIFGNDVHLSRSEAKDDRIAQPGYVGSRYRQGGLLFVAMNPGGANARMTEADERQLPLLRALAKASQRTRLLRFVELNRELERAMPNWNLVRFIVAPILEGLGLSFSQVAYINLVKWRTRKERMSSGLLRRSWELQTGPQFDLLRPSAVVCLGIATGNDLCRLTDQLPFNLTIPRVRKDCYSPPAQRNAIRGAIRSLRPRV